MMKQIPNFLQRFDLDLNADERAIRRAYARELKLIDQATEAERFQEMREMYEAALYWARRQLAEQEDHEKEPISDSSEVDTTADLQVDTAQYENIPNPSEIVSAELSGSTRREEEIQFDIQNVESMSEAVFDDFQNRFHAIVAQKIDCDEKLLKAELDKSIHNSYMDNMDVREMFEGRIAALLLQGWKPGHEVLMVVAGNTFHWVDDRSRLQRFGRMGYILDQAFAERESFFQQSVENRETNRKAINRLRNAGRPGNSELIERLRAIEKMVEIYPHWMPIIVDLDQIQRWRDWSHEVPSWQRFSIRPLLWKINNALPRFKWITPWRIVWAILIIGRAIMSSGHH
jgi:hypothetical protein